MKPCGFQHECNLDFYIYARGRNSFLHPLSIKNGRNSQEECKAINCIEELLNIEINRHVDVMDDNRFAKTMLNNY